MLQKTIIVPYVFVFDGVWRQADVLDVPPQLRQHLHRNMHENVWKVQNLSATNAFVLQMFVLCVKHLIGEECSESFSFSLQVQVHVKQLPVECLVNLLFPLHATGLLHGPLHTLPVQVMRQMTQKYAHMLCVIQGDAELPEGEEEKQGWKNEEEKLKNGGTGFRCE